jgi:hypothetical protein
LIWAGAICLQVQGLAGGSEGSGDEQGAVAGAAGFLHLDCRGAAISICAHAAACRKLRHTACCYARLSLAFESRIHSDRDIAQLGEH